MKKEYVILSGLVGVAALTGCFSNGREEAQATFLRGYAELSSSDKVPGRVTQYNNNGEIRIDGWYEYINEDGAKVRARYKDLGGDRYFFSETVVDTRSPAKQPKFEDLHKVNPNRDQIVEMGEISEPVSVGVWDGKTVLPKQNEGNVREN